ncbi:MAG TPA: o-succinylbenzoate synthase [Microbacteriaceae bacterium]|nr:o-succinylbenzoate synthase [Microbacteriaceae bacterium]
MLKLSSKPLPALSEVLASSHVVSIPTRTRFRGVTEREVVLFAGPKRWSEFSPFIEYDNVEASSWLEAALEFAWHPLQALHRDSVEVNATIPAVSPSEVPAILARFEGCDTVKVKVAETGQNLSDDINRVAAVREALGTDALIRIDANGGWSLSQAQKALSELKSFDLDYAEQPVMEIANLAKLRLQFAGEVKIAADESVRKAADPLAVARAEAADLLVVKVQPLGGVFRAQQIIEQAGLPVVISSALETSVGISMGAHLAAALKPEQLHGACGLGTAALLHGDVTRNPLLAKAGFIPVTEVQVETSLLDKFRASPDRIAWWRDRIERCYAQLNV